MQKALKLIWDALVNAYDAGWQLVLINLLWLLLCLPFLFVGFLLISFPGLISAVIIYPCLVALQAITSGLVYYMHELAHGESMSWKDYFVGIKKYFWPGMRYLLANLVVIFILLFYYIYFGELNNGLTPIIIGLIYGFGVIWLLLTPFLFPLMVEQKKPSIRTALRNSLVMYLKWPGVSLIAVILFYFLVVSSSYILIPWILLTASLSAFILSYVVMRKAEESSKLNQPESTERATSSS